MKTEQLINFTPKQITKMSEKELRKVVSTLRSTARKRYERLTEKGYWTIPMKTLSSKSPSTSDVLPSVAKADVITLRNEYKRFSQFLKAKTSTVTGAKKAEKQAEKLINDISGRDDFTQEEISEIYDLAGKLSLTDEISHIMSSTEKITAVVEEYSPNRSKNEILKTARKKVEDAYERQKRKEISTSEYFNQSSD